MASMPLSAMGASKRGNGDVGHLSLTRPCSGFSTDFPLCICRQQHNEGAAMRSMMHTEKKNGRTRMAAKGKSQMERCVALKAADFKAGVAINTNVGDGEHAYR